MSYHGRQHQQGKGGVIAVVPPAPLRILLLARSARLLCSTRGPVPGAMRRRLLASTVLAVACTCVARAQLLTRLEASAGSCEAADARCVLQPPPILTQPALLGAHACASAAYRAVRGRIGALLGSRCNQTQTHAAPPQLRAHPAPAVQPHVGGARLGDTRGASCRRVSCARDSRGGGGAELSAGQPVTDQRGVLWASPVDLQLRIATSEAGYSGDARAARVRASRLIERVLTDCSG